jgi:transposase-like protein
MVAKRRRHDAQFKFRVALAAARGDKTISELASETGVHPSQIGVWKRQLLENGDELFARKDGKKEQVQSAQEAELYEQIGRGTLWVQDGIRVVEKKSCPFRLTPDGP